jgi:hypothetical protein
MNFKKMLLASAAVLISSVSMAQISYGVKAGLNLNKSTYDEKPFVYYQTYLPAYFLTGYAAIPVCKNFSVQPGVSLQSKGDQYVFDGDGMDGKATWNVMTVEIPVNVVYAIPTGSVGDILLGAGPYAGISVAGKQKIEGTVTGFGAVGEKDMQFTGEQRDQNLIDAGANFSLGYKLKSGFLVQAEYGLGISNLNPDENSNKTQNRTLRFGLGFQF